MSVYFKKIAGEWVVYGPDEEVTLGEITVHKRNGNTTTATVERLGNMVKLHGDNVRIGHLEPRGEAKTYRERREAKAERLRQWSEKRQETAEAALESHPELRHDWAFITQPGRIPARERMNASDERAFESMRKAEDMASRADSIEAAASNAIYSDDPDAIERLEAKIAGLEAERARIKAYNASCRKGQRDVTLLDKRQQAQLAGTAKAASYQIRDNGAAPAYWAQNLTGNITRNRQRLERLKREKALLS